MRIQLLKSIAICALALGLTGCRVQSVRVMPSLTPYTYAVAGQTLEWLPYDPNVPLYVVFDGSSPCEKSSYQIGPDPARCKVTEKRTGYLAYHIQTTKPDSKDRHSIFQAKSCAYCRIAINPETISVAPSREVKLKDGSTSYNVSVTCDAGSAVVIDAPDSVQKGDLIEWIPLDFNTGLKVSASNICSGGNGGVFTGNDVCTVNGSASPNPYQYGITLDQCKGSGSLTIIPTPTAQ